MLDQVPAVRFAFSTRNGGVSADPFGLNLSFRVGDDPDHVAENRRRFFSTIGYSAEDGAFPLQCHSNRVQGVSKPGSYESCDALWTRTRGVPLAVSVADCLPVFLYDPESSVIAAIHAGWRGTVGSIVSETVRTIQRECGSDPPSMMAFIGPGADVCCYEVGKEVGDVFDPGCVTLREGKRFLNLKKANVNQLLLSGLKNEHIEVDRQCTICRADVFHSYRRDKERSGRMMGAIVLV